MARKAPVKGHLGEHFPRKKGELTETELVETIARILSHASSGSELSLKFQGHFPKGCYKRLQCSNDGQAPLCHLISGQGQNRRPQESSAFSGGLGWSNQRKRC